jgi:ABC-type phosphate transport system permease subunit
MKKIIQSVLLVPILLVVPLFANATPVYASGDDSVLCRLVPFLNDIPATQSTLCEGSTAGGEEAVSSTVAFAQLGVSFIFIGIILIAVYVIIKAAIKYIRSEGNEEKIQDAQKAIKQVFVGIGALFVGLIGLVIIIVFFNATGGINDADTDVQTDNPVLDQIL